MDILKKCQREDKATNELVLNSERNRTGTKRYPEYDSYKNNHGNELNNDIGKI